MPRILTQRYTFSVGAKRVVYIDCTSDLGNSSLTGTPTVEEKGTSQLTIPDGDKAINTSSYENPVARRKDKTVKVGKGILFSVSGGAAGSSQRIRVSCGTDSSPDEQLVYDIIVSWV